jgi:hypothetical protein
MSLMVFLRVNPQLQSMTFCLHLKHYFKSGSSRTFGLFGYEVIPLFFAPFSTFRRNGIQVKLLYFVEPTFACG